jgi:hypothetical protein
LSHFYLRKSYTFKELDEKLDDVKSEIKDFVHEQLRTRTAIIDPAPYSHYEIEKLLHELYNLRINVDSLSDEIIKLKSDKDYDEPTL